MGQGLGDIFGGVRLKVDPGQTAEENSRVLKAAMVATFEHYFNALLALPEKDGRKFAVTLQPAKTDTPTGAAYDVTVSYKPEKSAFGDAFFVQPVHGEPQPEIGLTLALDRGDVTATVTDKSVFGYKQKTFGNHLFQRTTPLHRALDEIKRDIEHIAPGRTAELPQPKAKADTPTV
jgi:hypothetical protein